ncbi:MAG TPA: TonB-dependent receptor plug domain-containing protein, partial [Arachidicoccus sp.]
MINNTRRLIKALFLCLSVVCAHAQDIHGNIRQQNDMPLAGMELFLEGTSYKSISDSSGNFRFNNVASGNYLLVTQSPAFEQIKKKITVNAQDIFIKLIAIQKDIQLADVFVEGKQYSSHDIASSYAARLPLWNIENPQTVNTVPQDVIVQQAATDFSAVLTNVAGIVKSWSSTNTYYTSRGFITRSYLRNGVASYSQSELDPANTEQFIVVKGPSGTLFGSPLVSFGGAFNRITKKPYDENGLNVSFLGGNMGFSRFTVDANAPLRKDKSLLFRINMAKTDMGSFQDQGLMKSTFVAPSLSYKVNDKLNINFEAEIYSREATSAPQISVTTDIADLKKYYDYKKSYQNNTVTLKDPYTAFYGQINYKISHGWLSQTNITHSKGDNTGNYLTFTLLGDSALARNVTQYPVTYDIVNHIQQNFIGDFNIGHFRNRIVAGLDFYND